MTSSYLTKMSMSRRPEAESTESIVVSIVVDNLISFMYPDIIRSLLKEDRSR